MYYFGLPLFSQLVNLQRTDLTINWEVRETLEWDVTINSKNTMYVFQAPKRRHFYADLWILGFEFTVYAKSQTSVPSVDLLNNNNFFSTRNSVVGGSTRLMDAASTPTWSLSCSWYSCCWNLKRQTKMMFPNSERRRQAINGMMIIQLRPEIVQITRKK